MRVARWGNSLAVRLPADLVRDLGLKEGDQIDLVKDDGAVKVRRQPRAEEILERVAFIRIHATRSNPLISHVREAQNRFPLLRDVL